MLTPKEALREWQLEGQICTTVDSGLINQTWKVGSPPIAVLQQVNPIFASKVNADISALTTRLESKGIFTPKLVPLKVGEKAGELWLDDPDGCWRLLSFVEGRTIHTISSLEQARTGGALVGRFHQALHGWNYTKQAPIRNVHDTTARMADLQQALDKCDGHSLAAPARALGQQILNAWSKWNGTLDQPYRICHGDLKVSNLRYSSDSDLAICLLDLDTIEPMPLQCELGDMWRSWCNPVGENDIDGVSFDLDVFQESATAFLRNGPKLSGVELESLAFGTERICLELAARFCGDAVNNCYFKEDLARYTDIGAHNLYRAQVQLKLAGLAAAESLKCSKIIKEVSK